MAQQEWKGREGGERGPLPVYGVPYADGQPFGGPPSGGPVGEGADRESEPEPGREPAVQVRGLWKRFGSQVAVAGVHLELPAGRFIGLVGPNGAGKTTTLSMVTGLLRPDDGTVRVVGHDVWADPVGAKSRIGILPEGLRLFERLSGRELLAYTGRLRGLPGAEVDRRADQLLEVLDLSANRHKLVVDYSTGMRKKIGLAAALLHNPEVLFLDEPFEGVDPVSAQVIRGVLERYTHSGGTVVFSSHVMELVESLCDWVAVMAAGRIVAHGPIAEVRGAAPTLQDAFLSLVGAGRRGGEDLDWLGGSAR
ncbi:ABC transporter ATP-binding protein [Actinacidiphila acididurans]|uniref:ABC transporter ATP-binding protein n=1 Tax=Actinacidiphila acididurans TaxID=2784346 RepID=A0ABS2TP79_9ACTN|nr:ABC transporter ATP-binding protein [Actinacidiphila acididurans]MBM9505143.1 ABC transporter ATP-binding protein [Actinacidiphila acididurans]